MFDTARKQADAEVRKLNTVYTVMRQKFSNWTLPRLLPQRTLDQLIGKQFGLTSAQKGNNRQ